MVFVGQNTLIVGADEKPPSHILFHKLCTQEGEDFPLVVSILEEPSVPVLLWNTGLAIPNPGTWAKATMMLCQGFEVVLWVSIRVYLGKYPCDSWSYL